MKLPAESGVLRVLDAGRQKLEGLVNLGGFFMLSPDIMGLMLTGDELVQAAVNLETGVVVNPLEYLNSLDLP